MARLHDELAGLLSAICNEWGFCLSAEDAARITQCSSMDADTFAFSIIRAEGFAEPEIEIEWQRRLRNRFVEHFGTASVCVNDRGL